MIRTPAAQPQPHGDCAAPAAFFGGAQKAGYHNLSAPFARTTGDCMWVECRMVWKGMAEPLLDRQSFDRTSVDERAEMGSADGMCAYESRRRLLTLSVAGVEDLRRAGMRAGKGPEGFCSDFQICLPYRGIFVWHVGHDDVVGDANQVVACRPGESFRMSGPLPDGYAELIITPDREVLSELANGNGQPLSDHQLFRRRAWRASPTLQARRTRFLHWACSSAPADPLEAAELLLALLRSALDDGERPRPPHAPSTARLIRRTKEFLEGRLSEPVRLDEVAREVGASPAYLTDLFRRVEGVSLHKYLTHLRLARALVELPHAADLTGLALSLGFSSHSHFSFAFRRAFGSTPSQFREHTRRASTPKPPAPIPERKNSTARRQTLSP
jgi:AraC-like DNA-binding protein